MDEFRGIRNASMLPGDQGMVEAAGGAQVWADSHAIPRDALDQTIINSVVAR
jgi:hypothetical protein